MTKWLVISAREEPPLMFPFVFIFKLISYYYIIVSIYSWFSIIPILYLFFFYTIQAVQ
jgi:hypothetical protein